MIALGCLVAAAVLLAIAGQIYVMAVILPRQARINREAVRQLELLNNPMLAYQIGAAGEELPAGAGDALDRRRAKAPGR